MLIVADKCFLINRTFLTKRSLLYFAGSLRSAAHQVQRVVRKSVRDEIGGAGDEEEVEDRDKELKEEQDQHQHKGRGKGKKKTLKRPAAATKDDNTAKAAKLETVPVPDEEEDIPPTQKDPKSPDPAEPPTPKKLRRRKARKTPEKNKKGNKAKKASPLKTVEPPSDDAKDDIYLDWDCLGIDVIINPV